MYKSVLKTFAILLLVSTSIVLIAHPSPSIALESTETLEVMAQPEPLNAGCNGGIHYENFETNASSEIAPSSEAAQPITIYEAPRVQRFTPPFYPYHVDTICICWDSIFYSEVTTNQYSLTVFDDDGDDNEPGSEILSFPVSRSVIPGARFYHHREFVPYHVDLTIESGAVYVGGVTLNHTDNPGVCTGTAAANSFPVVYSLIPGNRWLIDTIVPHPCYPMAVGIRLIGPYTDLLDGRLNTDPAQEAAVYCNSEYIDVYAIGDNSEGYLAFRVTWQDINALGIPDDDPILIEQSADGIRLYRLTTGELQVNAPTYDAINGYDYNGYSFTWSGCEAPE